MLVAVPDPRVRREVWHRLAVILGPALCAVLAGARSFTAIAGWAADADQATRDALGVTGAMPCESTFRRILHSVDADALDEAAGGWTDFSAIRMKKLTEGPAYAVSLGLLIRRSMEGVRSVRRNPYPQVSVLPDVRHGRRSPAPSGQSVRKL